MLASCCSSFSLKRKPLFEVALITLATCVLLAAVNFELNFRTTPRQCQDEPAYEAARSEIFSSKSFCPDSHADRQTHRHPIDCSNWLTTHWGYWYMPRARVSVSFHRRRRRRRHRHLLRGREAIQYVAMPADIISASLSIRIAERSAYATEESLVSSVGPHMSAVATRLIGSGCRLGW